MIVLALYALLVVLLNLIAWIILPTIILVSVYSRFGLLGALAFVGLSLITILFLLR